MSKKHKKKTLKMKKLLAAKRKDGKSNLSIVREFKKKEEVDLTEDGKPKVLGIAVGEDVKMKDAFGG